MMINSNELSVSSWSPWVIGIIATLSLVVVVNIVMVVFAVRSSKGTFEIDPYEQGMSYQSTIEKRRTIDRMGWTIGTELTPDGAGGAVLKLQISGSQGGIGALNVSGVIRRPSDRALDRSCLFSETEKGLYICKLDSIPAGLYYVTALIGDDGRFDAQIFLP